jgi:hypothetical protein
MMFQQNKSPPSSGSKNKSGKKISGMWREIDQLATFLFHPEDEGKMFLRNIGVSHNPVVYALQMF